jgi:hypothetical protein
MRIGRWHHLSRLLPVAAPATPASGAAVARGGACWRGEATSRWGSVPVERERTNFYGIPPSIKMWVG